MSWVGLTTPRHWHVDVSVCLVSVVCCIILSDCGTEQARVSWRESQTREPVTNWLFRAMPNGWIVPDGWYVEYRWTRLRECGSHPLAFGVGNTSKLSTKIALSLFLIGCDCLGNSDWKSVPHIRISKAKCTRDSTANTVSSKALVGWSHLYTNE